MTHNSDENLDALFKQARGVEPGPDLMARVLADADRAQEDLLRRPVSAPMRSWWTSSLAAIGGWSAVSGITAAGVMGLAVGLYSPDTVSAWLNDDTTLGSYELAPDVGGLWTEDSDV